MIITNRALARIPLLLLMLLGAPPAFALPSYSTNPGKTGTALLDELLAGKQGFTIRVSSNGCTAKNSFSVAVKKEAGISASIPHYSLTFSRTKPDLCKALLRDGVQLSYDMQQDLGITGNYTYSVTNPVHGASAPQPTAASPLAAMRTERTPALPAIKSVAPYTAERFVMDHDYFTCTLPSGWTKSDDARESEQTGIFELILTKKEKVDAGGRMNNLLPDPIISVAYYAPGNSEKKTFDSFLNVYKQFVRKNAVSKRSRYSNPEEIRFRNGEAVAFSYEVLKDEGQNGQLQSSYWMKSRFVAVRAEDGFYLLGYRSPGKFYESYLPVFNALADTFMPMTAKQEKQ